MRTVRCSDRLLWTEFLAHACENITFPQLRLRTVKIPFHWAMYDTAIFILDNQKCSRCNTRMNKIPWIKNHMMMSSHVPNRNMKDPQNVLK